MKALILGGGPATALYPLASHNPVLASPIANKPLITHVLQSLERVGFDEVAIVAAQHLPYYRALERIQRRRRRGPRLTVIEQHLPTGTAGSLRDTGAYMKDGPVLVLSPSVYLERLDIASIFAFHVDRRAGLTVVVERGSPCGRSLENISVLPDGRIQRFILLHESRDRRRRFGPRDPAQERRQTRCSAGIYVVGPEVLESLPARGYMDIKEQLIPNLAARDVPVYAYQPGHPLRHLRGLHDYLELNGGILRGSIEAQDFIFEGQREVQPWVWVGENVTIARSAVLRGPMFIGRNCSIGEDVTVIGPACIGAASTLGRGSLVRESVLGRRVSVGEGVTLERSVVADNCNVGRQERLRHAAVVDARTLQAGHNLLPRRTSDGFDLHVRGRGSAPPSRARHVAYLATKRLMDITVSTIALTLLAPLMAVIALLIKWDSPGPALFIQRRCGRTGREFAMLKFRTMVANAPDLHASLIPEKDVDGPMFKLERDPRITRVGGILRKTSLDELPQLVNVLKGEMSLVGPRPLVMHEMGSSPVWRDVRLMVRPGITGLWQINGRESVAFHDWIRHDVHYVKHQSLLMDCKILLSTFRVLKNATNV